MASIVRSMRRNMARRNGTFVAQKPLRARPDNTKQSFMNNLRIQYKMMREQIKENDVVYTDMTDEKEGI